jgi:hypothetical protein
LAGGGQLPGWESVEQARELAVLILASELDRLAMASQNRRQMSAIVCEREFVV